MIGSSFDLLTDLREGTKALHIRLESRLDLNSQFSTLLGYRNLLVRYFQFYAPLEKELFGPSSAKMWTEVGLDYVPRRKSHLLKSDLRFLGLNDSDLYSLALCPSYRLPRLESCSELIGAAYVIEGATLGGQYIASQLTSSLGLMAGATGARFFFGYGSETGAHWKQFRSAAENYVNEQESTQRGAGAKATEIAIKSARATFLAIESWILSEVDGIDTI